MVLNTTTTTTTTRNHREEEWQETKSKEPSKDKRELNGKSRMIDKGNNGEVLSERPALMAQILSLIL